MAETDKQAYAPDADVQNNKRNFFRAYSIDGRMLNSTLAKIAMRQGVPRDSIDDILQNFYVYIYEKSFFNSYHGHLSGNFNFSEPSVEKDELMRYLGASFWNYCIDYWRRGERREKLEAEIGHGEERFSLELIAAKEKAPDISSEQRMMQDYITQLSPIRREIITLYYYDRMSYRQMAEALNIPEGTVKSRLHEAIGALRKLVEGQKPQIIEDLKDVIS